MALVFVNSRAMKVRQNLIMHEAECISRFTPGSHVTHVTLKVKSNTHVCSSKTSTKYFLTIASNIICTYHKIMLKS